MYIQDTKGNIRKVSRQKNDQIRQFYPVMSINEKNLCAIDKK
jgi:hypothetical protein